MQETALTTARLRRSRQIGNAFHRFAVCKNNTAIIHFIILWLTHYQTTNFRHFQTEGVLQTTISKFDENGKKLSKQVENTVGKGEIVRYEQFLLFPQCFQEACFPGASKGVIVWEWVNMGQIFA